MQRNMRVGFCTNVFTNTKESLRANAQSRRSYSAAAAAAFFFFFFFFFFLDDVARMAAISSVTVLSLVNMLAGSSASWPVTRAVPDDKISTVNLT